MHRSSDFLSLSQAGKRPRKEPRFLTDEEYEEIFAAVLDVQLGQPEENNTSPGKQYI